MTASIEATPISSATPNVAINDIGDEEAFLAAIDETIKYFNDGDIVEGVIVKVDRDEVLLDIGYKTEGVIPSRELSIKHDVDPNEVVSVGDEVEALVLQKEDKEGRLILSKKRAQYERAWGTIEKIKEEDGIVTGTVIEVVKGGLILDIGLRGFLPASLVEMRRVRDLQPYVGKELEAKIIELDKNRNNVVLSRRAWLEQTQSEVRSTFLQTLQKGQVRSGVVSSIVNFGAFVDLGGVDGLVHVSELSWKHIDHPSEVVEVGQEVTVEVLDVDMDRERVSLSLKATQEDPWQQFARTHQIGQVVPGKVTKLVPFGSFVRVDEGIEGLVHISELAERHVEIPEQVVQVGDEIFVKVIDIDLERRRISLSLKQANEGVAPPEGDDSAFDPTLYGMSASYDEAGNYQYPEGFDPETNEWLPGHETQQAEWERQYAEARVRYEAHMKQVTEAAKAEAEANLESGSPSTYSSEAAPEQAETGDMTSPRQPAAPAAVAPWPPTRRSPLCARSSPATSSRPRLAAAPHRGPAPDRCGASVRPGPEPDRSRRVRPVARIRRTTRRVRPRSAAAPGGSTDRPRTRATTGRSPRRRRTRRPHARNTTSRSHSPGRSVAGPRSGRGSRVAVTWAPTSRVSRPDRSSWRATVGSRTASSSPRRRASTRQLARRSSAVRSSDPADEPAPGQAGKVHRWRPPPAPGTVPHRHRRAVPVHQDHVGGHRQPTCGRPAQLGRLAEPQAVLPRREVRDLAVGAGPQQRGAHLHQPGEPGVQGLGEARQREAPEPARELGRLLAAGPPPAASRAGAAPCRGTSGGACGPAGDRARCAPPRRRWRRACSRSTAASPARGSPRCPAGCASSSRSCSPARRSPVPGSTPP